MNTKIISLIILIVVAGFGAYVLTKSNSDIRKPAEVQLPLDTQIHGDGKYCFAMMHAASPSEPYEVEEHIAFDIAGDVVIGTKTGTQKGPDMQNGYQGTLSGVKNGNELDLVYSYMIEGSQDKEEEIYEMSGDSLVRMRYPFLDKDDTLVPDRKSEPKLITYSKEACPGNNN